MPERICSIDGCCRKHSAKGLCKRHYRQQPDQVAKAKEYQSSAATMERRRRSDRKRQARRQAYITEWGRRQAMPRWAAEWEAQRLAEDLADLAIIPVVYGKGAQRLDAKPARLFIGSHCRSCGETWVQYANRVDSDLCSSCTKRKWRMNHRRRARHYGVEHEHIDHHEVFAADGYRCQICKRKTRGTHPNPRSPTLDHIVPLSKGGPHLRHNVQTACLECNTNKGNRTANDQLRLALVA